MTGLVDEIGYGSVITTTTKNVDALRKAIIDTGFGQLKGRTFDDLVVKLTRDGVPLPISHRLRDVPFPTDEDGNRQVYVEVVPPGSSHRCRGTCFKLLFLAKRPRLEFDPLVSSARRFATLCRTKPIQLRT